MKIFLFGNGKIILIIFWNVKIENLLVKIENIINE